MKNLLTFDIEDWFHILDCPSALPASKWRYLDGRVAENTLHILDLLDRHGIRATFFVLGWVAEQCPDLVREIDRRGHEVGSHGDQHQRVDQITADEFRRDVANSLEKLTPLVSEPIKGYRAPGFSIHPGCYHALDILAELGITYDSSIFPARHVASDDLCIPTEPGWITTPSGFSLFEIPATPLHFPGKSIYLFGGGYFRLAPAYMTRLGIQKLNARKQAALVYLHPREFDPHHPHLPMSPYRRFTSYINVAGTQEKLEYLLNKFEFGSIDELSKLQVPSENPTVLIPRSAIPAC